MKKSVAIIGFGAVTRLYHLPYILQNSNFILEYIIDPYVDLINIKNDFNIPSDVIICKDIDNFILHNNLPDIFIIATPPNTHFQLINKLLDFNKIILVEKPFLINSKELDLIIRKLTGTNTTLYVNQMRRFLPTLNFIKSIITNNNLGEISDIKIYEGYKSAWKTVSNYNLLTKLNGGGHLIDTGIHIIDSLLYMTNIQDFKIQYYSDDSTNTSPDSEFTLKLIKNNLSVYIYSTRNSNITPYYEFNFQNAKLYFYLNNHNLVFLKLNNHDECKIEVSPIYTYDDSFADVYQEILTKNFEDSKVSRISCYNNFESVELLHNLIIKENINYDNDLKHEMSNDIKKNKILVFGGNSYVAKEFIKYAITNNYLVDIISRNPVHFNIKMYDDYIKNYGWDNSEFMNFNSDYEFSINFSYDTSLDYKKNILLIKNINKIIKKKSISKNFHLSSIAVYNDDHNLKKFNLINKYFDKYSYIKNVTEFEFLNTVQNSIILRCGNFVGLDSPLWVNSFINFIIERRVFPNNLDKNSNILLTDDFSEFVLNFNQPHNIVDVVSQEIKWKTYIENLSEILNIKANFKDIYFENSLRHNIKDILFLFSNNPVILGYLKNSKIFDIFSNFKMIKKLFLSFRKIKKNKLNTNDISKLTEGNKILIQSSLIDKSVLNVLNSDFTTKSFVNNTSNNYKIFLHNLKLKFNHD